MKEEPCEDRRDLEQAVLSAAHAVGIAKTLKSTAALKSARIIARRALGALNRHVKEHGCKN
jgi:hypothetical protein